MFSARTAPLVVVADDHKASRRMIAHILNSEGLQVKEAENGRQVLHLFLTEQPDMVLLDIVMPVMDGLEACRKIKELTGGKLVPVLMVTAKDEGGIMEQAYQAGASDFVTKPINKEELRHRVRRLLYLRKLEREREKAELQLLESREGIIRGMGKMIEKRDPYTAGHQRRVAALAVSIAREMGLEKERIEGLRLASLIHDIGKIAIPAEILTKPGKLSEIEFSMMKMHPQVGSEILGETYFPWPIARIIAQHHEKIDGSGYPSGLKDHEILLEAKILCVADVVEAINSHRPYRPALGMEEALGEIDRQKGCCYDPDVTKACLYLFWGKGLRLEQLVEA